MTIDEIKAAIKDRTKPRLSIKHIAHEAGIHYQTLYNIMRDKTKVVEPETLTKLEKYLGS